MLFKKPTKKTKKQIQKPTCTIFQKHSFANTAITAIADGQLSCA